MPRYFYRVKDSSGQTSKGQVETESESQAIEKLSSEGYFILSLSEQELTPQASPPQPSEKSPVADSEKAAPKKIKLRDLAVSTRQMADLINAGVTLLHVLDILRNQVKINPGFYVIVDGWYKDIQAGLSFSQSMERFKDYLPSVLPALVASGEASGNLDQTLRQAAELFEQEYELQAKVKSALIYPSLVAAMGAITVFVLLSFVIPKIAGIFTEMGAALPLLTSIIIGVSDIFARFWWMIIAVVGGLFFFLKILLKSPQHKLTFDRFKLSVPLLKKLILESEIARLSRILGMLLNSGVPILEAIEVTVPVMDTEVYKGELQHMAGEIRGGKSLTSTMTKENLFPQFATDMLKVGEESGKLDDSLIKVAGAYERSLAYTIKVLTQLLEPILIMVVGLIIGLIVIGMLLPIFQLNMIIK